MEKATSFISTICTVNLSSLTDFAMPFYNQFTSHDDTSAKQKRALSWEPNASLFL